MFLPRFTTLWLAAALLTGCSPKSQDTSKQAVAPDSDGLALVSADSAAPVADSLAVDLLAFKEQGLLTPVSTVRVADDPVFHKAKTFRAVDLRVLLRKHLPLNTLDTANTQVVFECEDGYSPSMPLRDLLARQSYLAVADADAPAGQDWINAVKEGREMKVAPFYVVYTDVPADDYRYKWPYNLVRLRLVPATDETKVLLPKDGLMVKGYDLFRTHCLTCHALNGVGGQMGPELNYPMNVTEYWQPEHLRAFVKNPSAYRNNCKMPHLSYLTDAQIDEILKYVGYMKDFKTLAKR
ncbi:MAG: c-type cytochrome [Cytophagales bacterium]|jgi:mono/diheme cytochrome c family protein|nr:c-type cytochrome [Cytophagales bacterium]